MVNDLNSKRKEPRSMVLAQQFSDAAENAYDKALNIYTAGLLCTTALAIGTKFADLSPLFSLTTLAIAFGWSYLEARNTALSLKNKFNDLSRSGTEDADTLADLKSLKEVLENVPDKGLPALKRFSGKTVKSPQFLAIGAMGMGIFGWFVSPYAMPFAIALTIGMAAKSETENALKRTYTNVVNVRMEQTRKLFPEIDKLLAEIEQRENKPAGKDNGPELKP